MELGVECKDRDPEENQAAAQRSDRLPMTSEDALRLSIKLAVDTGDYERAIALLEVAKRIETKVNAVTRLWRMTGRGEPGSIRRCRFRPWLQ